MSKTAASVPEGLETVGQAKFDAIITDLKMPKVGGLDFIRALNARSFDGAIIVVSGHGAVSNRADALALGRLPVWRNRLMWMMSCRFWPTIPFEKPRLRQLFTYLPEMTIF